MTSKYYKVKCECGQEMKIFSHVTSEVYCPSCKEAVAHPSGGEAVIHAEIVEELS
jgi:ribosomal protein S27E